MKREQRLPALARLLCALVVMLCPMLLATAPARSETILVADGPPPLSWLNEDQRKALGQLYTGYAEGFACGREINLDVASSFLKSRVGENFTADQVAAMTHMAVAIQVLNVGRAFKTKLSSEQLQAHCTTRVGGAFGPSGTVVKGLLK